MYTLDKTEGHTSTVSGVYVVSIMVTMRWEGGSECTPKREEGKDAVN